KIEDQDNVKLVSQLKPNVVSAMSTAPMAVPVNTGPLMSGELTSYYDPSGADFKQGIYGTAPPGPALVVPPGDGAQTVFGLPSGTMTKLCFDPNQVTDTAGNKLDTSKDGGCVTLNIKPFSFSTLPGGMENDVHLSDITSSGITVNLSAPAA